MFYYNMACIWNQRGIIRPALTGARIAERVFECRLILRLYYRESGCGHCDTFLSKSSCCQNNKLKVLLVGQFNDGPMEDRHDMPSDSSISLIIISIR